MSQYRVSAIQMVSTNNLNENLAEAERLVEAAAAEGAQLIVLPETFAMFSARQQKALGQREASADAVIRPFISALAKRLGIWIVAGTVPVAVADSEQVLSSCFVVDDQGIEQACYNKIHLFDVDVADSQGSYRESDTFLAGNEAVVIDTPFGRLGLAVCYDIRFPELFRLMFAQGVDIIAVPAAFTLLTGKAHWLPLLQARAIENQCYIVGANQGGEHTPSRSTSGDSVVIDGWGNIVAKADSGPAYIVAEVDTTVLEKQRRAMPIKQHQRFGITAE
ncbi:carbon-nitrogen hydrolase family protein [Oceanicoccus sagamiensis]|uniref:Carbon-nitrogen hydrolase n=1 Tax=Oceanicoccus sagamiensis TaxID=716816 RepID=A0A1X9NG44_9GAMM|nr:carbon-nitrogen hydrolase family protein [Oceanicoccus sagamiensis]ARN72973.1 carbon-nitrogen hydrolase [Oceanicoccus sagamiensis]